MEFCSNCGRVLVPKDGKLVCSGCGFRKNLDDSLRRDYIIEEDVSNKQELIVTDDRVNTMPTTRGLCYRCHNRELEWWMVQTRKSDEATTIFYRCTKCGNTWRR